MIGPLNTAIFGLVSFQLTDSFSITAEARYQEEDIEQNVVLQSLGSPPTGTVQAKETYDAFLPRVTLDWQFNPDHMVYALYAEGTKPGGFNSATAIQAGLPSYDEEDVESIEIGSKNVFADGQVVLNIAAYFNQISGYQLTQNARNNLGNTTSATVNAGDADVVGAEVEFSYRPATVEGRRNTGGSWAGTSVAGPKALIRSMSPGSPAGAGQAGTGTTVPSALRTETEGSPAPPVGSPGASGT